MVDVILPRAIGASPVFSIGTVTTGPVAVTLTGTDLSPVLNFTIPDGGGVSPPFPISDVTGLQSALDLKAPLANPTFTGTVSGITAGMIGLGLVNNTSDADKPISTATQAALDGKQPVDADLTAIAALTGTNTIYYRSAVNTWTAVTIGTGLTFTGGTLAAAGGGGGSGDVVGPASATNNGVALFDGTTGKLLKDGPLLSTYALLASPTFTGVPAAPTATAGTNTTQIATTAFVTAAAALKANLASPTFTGTPAAPTATAGTSTTQLATTAFVTTAVADAKPIQVIAIAISDETTAITTGTAKATFRMPYAFTLTAVRASLTTASSSGLPTFDINENGATILSTKITIDASEKTSTTAATAPVISDASLADDAEITIDIDVAGTGATGAKIYLIGRRT